MTLTFESMVQEWVEHRVSDGCRVQIHVTGGHWTVHTFERGDDNDIIMRMGCGVTFRDAVEAHDINPTLDMSRAEFEHRWHGVRA